MGSAQANPSVKTAGSLIRLFTRCLLWMLRRNAGIARIASALEAIANAARGAAANFPDLPGKSNATINAQTKMEYDTHEVPRKGA